MCTELQIIDDPIGYDKNRNSYAISDSSNLILIIVRGIELASIRLSFPIRIQIYTAIHGFQIEWVDVP